MTCEGLRALAIVDDDRLYEELDRKLRAAIGGDTTGRARDVESGLRELARERYDVVLLDALLPDGYDNDAVRRLQSAVEAVPVIALVSHRNHAVAALRAGALETVHRDEISSRELLLTVRFALERYRLVSELREARMRAQALAGRDPLTELPNRAWLMEYLPKAVALAERHGGGLVLCFIDLDGFKQANDSFGHAAGDAVLSEAAGRLRAITRSSDVLARLGGDEFVVVLGNTIDRKGAERYAQSVSECLRQPFHVDGSPLWLSASLGLTMFPDDGRTPELLLSNADTAMYEAKKVGKNRFTFFEPKMSEAAREVADNRRGIRDAVVKKQLFLTYQPQFDIQLAEVAGAEALVRWEHPSRGLVTPHDFIPIAESSGVVHELGEWVRQEASRTLEKWEALGHPSTIAVNVSPHELGHPAFADRLAALCEGLGPLSHRLELEVTESRLLGFNEAARQNLQAVRCLGVKIAIDDFGTGLSSLSLLRCVAARRIKIDRAFVSSLPFEPASRAIVRGILQIASELGVLTVGTGVELLSEAIALRELGCDQLQGYLVARPMSASTFARWMESRAVETLKETLREDPLPADLRA